MDTFFIKRGDTSPALRFILDPASVVLTGAAVRFQMRDRSGATVIDQPATIVTDTGTPTVQYAWQPTDTAVSGGFEAEFRVTYGDAKIETFPNVGFIPVRISDDVR